MRGDLTTHKYPETFSDITLNGVSIVDLGVMEVGIDENGRGYALTQIDPILGGEEVVLIDGQTKNHTTWGEIALVE